MSTAINWNAIRTRAHMEKNVCALLQKKKISYFFPQNQLLAETFQQKKIIVQPLFPSTIFVQELNDDRLPALLACTNVINIVYWQQHPAVIRVAEIESLRHFLEAHETVQVSKTIMRQNSTSEPCTTQFCAADKTYTLTLPSIGYSLSAKAEQVTHIKLIRKNAGAHRPTESLAFLLGLKTISNKFQ